MLNHMSDLARKMVGELQINVPNSLVGLIIIVGFKGRKATTKLEAKNSKTPDVDSFIMRFFKNHFWRKIIKGST